MGWSFKVITILILEVVTFVEQCNEAPEKGNNITIEALTDGSNTYGSSGIHICDCEFMGRDDVTTVNRTFSNIYVKQVGDTVCT